MSLGSFTRPKPDRGFHVLYDKEQKTMLWGTILAQS